MNTAKLTIIAFLFTATSAFNLALAKQCIWNKAGFILNITWMKDGNIARKDQIALGQGNCSDDQEYNVILSIQDGKLASDFTRAAITAAAIAAAVATGGATAAGSASLVGALANKGIPDPQEIFYTGTPSSDHYLDVWGTVWSPQTGEGSRF